MKLNGQEMIKYSLIAFLLLFILIFYIDMNYKPEIRNIDELTVRDVNKKIAIKGLCV